MVPSEDWTVYSVLVAGHELEELSEVTQDSHFSTSSLPPSTESVSAKESSPGATEPRPFRRREDGRPPIPLLQQRKHKDMNEEVRF